MWSHTTSALCLLLLLLFQSFVYLSLIPSVIYFLLTFISNYFVSSILSVFTAFHLISSPLSLYCVSLPFSDCPYSAWLLIPFPWPFGCEACRFEIISSQTNSSICSSVVTPRSTSTFSDLAPTACRVAPKVAMCGLRQRRFILLNLHNRFKKCSSCSGSTNPEDKW